MEKLYKGLESYELYEISIELICFVETWGFYQKVEAVQNPLYYYITLSLIQFLYFASVILQFLYFSNTKGVYFYIFSSAILQFSNIDARAFYFSKDARTFCFSLSCVPIKTVNSKTSLNHQQFNIY